MQLYDQVFIYFIYKFVIILTQKCVQLNICAVAVENIHAVAIKDIDAIAVAIIREIVLADICAVVVTIAYIIMWYQLS